MRLKVCGITDIQQLNALDAMKVDLAGFIFYPHSPRFVLHHLSASKIAASSVEVKKVGVFVNAGYDEIMQQVSAYKLDYIQLHGEETPELTVQLSKAIKTIKTFRIASEDDFADLSDYQDATDLFLFDTRAIEHGGTGKKFDWQLLLEQKIQKPFLLSGGIGMEDVEALHAFRMHPHASTLYGIDVNSRFEISPGIKDMQQIRAFITQFQNH